ncbi:hypothetical protein C7S20_16705 [Christiangramia fulva]|uniref:Uncharacterized protein n=1 Tax=Christiangramia fulva TaxID=2126553 RepID=A0A2R3Z925_9FLAO|nr:hypothetical protein [Christiangramia fulva]AVR46769.1 hypothetical protein C7S20_16705 [Christiangramia fulva]
MDYKELFEQYYKSTFRHYEKWLKLELVKYKKEERTYRSAEKRSRQKVYDDYFAIPPKNQENFFYEIAQGFDNKDKHYTSNSISKILSNEVRDLYEENENSTFGSYIEFIQTFSKYKAIYDVYNLSGRISRIVKTYYDQDELFRFKLEPLNHYKEYSDFNRLVKEKYPSYSSTDLEKIDIDPYGEFYIENQKDEILKESKPIEKKPIEDSPLPNLDDDEKLLLIHYLLKYKSLTNTEKVKIFALLGKTPVDISIFQESARENTLYNKIQKGHKYYGTKKATAKLKMLYSQIEYLEIDNLKGAIKVDLARQKEVKFQRSIKKK